MTSPLTPATVTRLEKAAVNNGFDRELPREGDWLAFGSTRAPLRLWLTAVGDALFLAAVSQQNVVRAFTDHGTAFTHPLPPGASGARGVIDFLLAPHLDAAFDRGLITVADTGGVVVAAALGAEDRHLLGLDVPLRVRGLTDGHRAYLRWHRERVFRRHDVVRAPPPVDPTLTTGT